MNKVLHTKFGKATLNNWGYYRIASLKEGNAGNLARGWEWIEFETEN